MIEGFGIGEATMDMQACTARTASTSDSGDPSWFKRLYRGNDALRGPDRAFAFAWGACEPWGPDATIPTVPAPHAPRARRHRDRGDSL
jgi:hypothetical protein